VSDTTKAPQTTCSMLPYITTGKACQQKNSARGS